MISVMRNQIKNKECSASVKTSAFISVKGSKGQAKKSPVTQRLTPSPIESLSHPQSRSSQSPLFMESYANMQVLQKKLLSKENLIKICVGDF